MNKSSIDDIYNSGVFELKVIITILVPVSLFLFYLMWWSGDQNSKLEKWCEQNHYTLVRNPNPSLWNRAGPQCIVPKRGNLPVEIVR